MSIKFRLLQNQVNIICHYDLTRVQKFSSKSFETKGKLLRASQVPLDYKGSKRVCIIQISQEDTIKNHPVQELLYMLLFLIKPFETRSGVIFLLLLVCVWSSCCSLSIYRTFFSTVCCLMRNSGLDGRSLAPLHRLSTSSVSFI